MSTVHDECNNARKELINVLHEQLGYGVTNKIMVALDKYLDERDRLDMMIACGGAWGRRQRTGDKEV